MDFPVFPGIYQISHISQYFPGNPWNFPEFPGFHQNFPEFTRIPGISNDSNVSNKFISQSNKMKCPLCIEEFKNKTSLRSHLSTDHKGDKPFICRKCPTAFTTESACTRHENTCEIAVTITDTVAFFRDFHHLQVETLQLADFSMWYQEYERRSNRFDFTLAASTLLETIQFNKHHMDIPWASPVETEEYIEDLITNNTCLHATLVQRLRHLLWKAKHMYSLKVAPISTLHWLQDLISSQQRVVTIASTKSGILSMLDPYQLLNIRNRVVQLLREAQSEIDGMILAPCSDMVTWGAKHLRPWLELALRFTNIPMRVQCSSHLLMPSATDQDYVSKLVLHGNEYHRVIATDKTQAQPLSLPMGMVLSTYLHFYIHHCQASASKFVFQTKTGRQWVKTSRDVKQWLSNRGIDVEMIEHSGRFVHGSRHIALATHAIQTGFDERKMESFSALLRTSLETVKKFYSPWWKLHHQKQALADFFETNGLRRGTVTVTPVVLTLKPMSAGLNVVVWGDLSAPTLYDSCSQGTQTDLILHSLPGSDKTCLQCGQSVDWFGPVGLARAPQFGQFWYSHCGVAPVFTPLGEIPTDTKSNKPRNLDQIIVFIEQKLGIHVRVDVERLFTRKRPRTY